MTATRNRQSKRQVILESWATCAAQAAGALELKTIQHSLKETLGIVDSPASIARVLADEGVRLRHPEVLEFDSTWRERRIHELFGPGEIKFDTLASAVDSVDRIDELFLLFESEGDEEGARAVVELVRELKSDLSADKSRLAREVSQWLTVFLQNPQIFTDWLNLRRNSSEFLREFGNRD